MRKTKITYPKTTNIKQLPPEIQKVMIAVSNLYHITPDKLWHKTRKDEIVDARHIAVSVIYENYGNGGEIRGYSLGTIGSFFNRDHTTVLHSIQIAKDLCETDDKFNDNYNRVNESCKTIARRPRVAKFIEIIDQLSLENSLKAFEFIDQILELQKIEEATKLFPTIPKENNT